MKTFGEYHEEIKQNAVRQWTKDGHAVFEDMENDPVINLMLSALSYQAFHIQKNIEQYEENILRDFRDRILPFQLIKPVPAFSIVETQLVKAFDEEIINEDSLFEFKSRKFSPLLETKIINAEFRITAKQEESCRVELQLANPIESLSGLSFFIDADPSEPVDIAAIKYEDYELPLIKPSQYNELPFTKWFNNAHLLQDQNYYLFGSYDYWQEIFLTNTSRLFYIGQYDTRQVPLNGKIELEIIFNSQAEVVNDIKINCIPVVNVEKKEAVLNDKNPVQELSSGTGEFLNLLYSKEMEKNTHSFLVRQNGVERYNHRQLLEQMQEMIYRYGADFYAFQSINELKNGEKLKKMQEVIDEISGIVTKFEKENRKETYYAVLKKQYAGNENIDLEYLTTSGKAANGIRKAEKAEKAPNRLDSSNTILLLETKGGKNSVKDETQKEEIAKYYFQTKDRIITPADIRTFVKTFRYKGILLSNKIEDILINRGSGEMVITVKLKDDSLLKTNEEKRQREELLENKEKLGKILQTKITLRSSGIMPFKVKIY